MRIEDVLDVSSKDDTRDRFYAFAIEIPHACTSI
jgi:hypothetical protein